MYTYKEDASAHVFACRLFKGGEPDLHFETHVRELKRASQQSHQQGTRLSAMIIMSFGHPLPNSFWRTKVAELMTEPDFDPYLAVVTVNPAVRGILTALSWGTKERSAEFKAFRTSAAALAWLEEKRDAPLESLRRLVAEVRATDQTLQDSAP